MGTLDVDMEALGPRRSGVLGVTLYLEESLEGFEVAGERVQAVRLYLGKHHYRRPWSHNVDELAKADRLALPAGGLTGSCTSREARSCGAHGLADRP
jgi:hypothetical protein